MTNEIFDIQPALRPHSTLVRGGRLTKFKGQVASIAPGLLVASTAALLFSGGAAQAADECGPPVNGQVTCNADADDSTPNVVDPYANGITYNHAGSDGLTLKLDDADIEVGGSGVRVEGTSEGNISVQMDGGKITTSGEFARALWARTTGTGAALALMGGGSVTTNGRDSYGLYASTGDGSAATAQLDGGSVATVGVAAYGLRAVIFNDDNEATATARMTAGDVRISSNNTHGLFARTFGRGEARAEMGGGAVTTVGEAAFGLWAQSERGQAIVNLGAGAVVTVSGAGAAGIVAGGARGFDVDVAGFVTGGAKAGIGANTDGAAIRTISSAGGTIDITSTAEVMAGRSDVAIQGADGDTVITSAGTITGDILFGAGNDTLRLTGGSFTGGIYAGAGDDTVTISAAAIYDMSYTLDGGAGGNDHLALSGRRTIATSADSFGDWARNWERLTLKDETELSLDGVATLDTDLSIDARSEFRAFGGEGGMTIRGDVTNDGDLTLSVQDGKTGDVITIEGDYTGSGTSTFALDARMDGTDTDKLHFTGDMSGDMELLIASVGSAGATGGPLEIDMVTVDGEADGTFTLVGGNHVMSDGEHGVISGAYLYTLAAAADGRSWALSALSESGEMSYQPSAPLYDSYGASLLAMNGLSSLRNRGSSQDFRSLASGGGAAATQSDAADQDTGSPLWIQMGTEQITSSEAHSTTGAALESSLWEMEIGADIVISESGAGLLVGGLMLSYAASSTEVTSSFGDGSIETTGLGLGVAATWHDARRFYIDGQATWTSYSSDLTSDGNLGALTEGNSGTGFALSLEAGQQFDLGSRLTVIPQSQLSFSSVGFEDFASEAHGEQVALSDASSQRLRLGLEFAGQGPEARRLYGIVNLFHDFGAGSEVEVAGTSLTTESEPWAVGVGIGGNYAWNDRVDLFGEASYATGLSTAGDTSALGVNAGLKVMF